jgi:hypothetical protein
LFDLFSDAFASIEFTRLCHFSRDSSENRLPVGGLNSWKLYDLEIERIE